MMTVTVKEITWNELIDRIREQSARIHETDPDETRYDGTAFCPNHILQKGHQK